MVALQQFLDNSRMLHLIFLGMGEADPEQGGHARPKSLLIFCCFHLPVERRPCLRRVLEKKVLFIDKKKKSTIVLFTIGGMLVYPTGKEETPQRTFVSALTKPHSCGWPALSTPWVLLSFLLRSL